MDTENSLRTSSTNNSPNNTPDILIAGGGVIGLSLALELYVRGAKVTVVERDTALAHASSAAAGMLAVHDPHNAPELLELSELSGELYPGFLARIEKLSGLNVPFHTDTTLQYEPDGSFRPLAEHSLEPGELAQGMIAAVRASSIRFLEHTTITRADVNAQGVTAFTNTGEMLHADQIVYATGAWAETDVVQRYAIPVVPRKGQVMRVEVPTGAHLREVHRGKGVYVMPRLHGPQNGSAIIGATVEDAGFNLDTDPAKLLDLRRMAAALSASLAWTLDTPEIEAWAGTRPGTLDELPLLGQIGETREYLALGHYRNGILLAPGTAVVMADLLEGKAPTVDLSAFSTSRFAPEEATVGA